MASRYQTKSGKVRWRGRVWTDGREHSKTFATKREAQVWESALRGTAHRPDMTVRAWLEGGGRGGLMAELSAATQRTYATNLDKRIVPVFGNRRLSSITPGQIERARNAWRSGGLSASAVNGTLNTLARLLR